MSKSLPLFSLVFTTLAFASPVAAQVSARPPLTGEQVMQALREKGSIGHAQRTLMQIDGPVPRGVQDELADSMVAFVSAVARRGSTHDANAVLSIVHALSLSGMRGMSGTPYAGAGERLMNLAHSVDPTTGARIVYALSELADQTEARARLRTFATSAQTAAYIAIEHLARMEPEGVVVLRELWEKQAVTEPKARERLQSIAGHFDWTRSPTPPSLRRPPHRVRSLQANYSSRSARLERCGSDGPTIRRHHFLDECLPRVAAGAPPSLWSAPRAVARAPKTR